MSAKKYMTITGASKATTTRDLQDLVRSDILIPHRRLAEHSLSGQL